MSPSYVNLYQSLYWYELVTGSCHYDALRCSDISPRDPQPSARDTQGVVEVRAPYRDAILYLGSGTVPLTSDNAPPVGITRHIGLGRALKINRFGRFCQILSSFI